MKETPAASRAVNPVTWKVCRAAIDELADTASLATALAMAACVEADASCSLMPETTTALSAPGVRCIVMVYDTTPLPSMVAVTEAPSGKAPSALRVALIASSKYLEASVLSPAVKPVRVVVSCPVLVTSATTDWLVAPAVLPPTVVPVRAPMILNVTALSSDDWMLATAAFANSEEAPSKVISYETAPFSMLVMVTVAPMGRSAPSAMVMAASKSSMACASSAAVMINPAVPTCVFPSTLTLPRTLDKGVPVDSSWTVLEIEFKVEGRRSDASICVMTARDSSFDVP